MIESKWLKLLVAVVLFFLCLAMEAFKDEISLYGGVGQCAVFGAVNFLLFIIYDACDSERRSNSWLGIPIFILYLITIVMLCAIGLSNIVNYVDNGSLIGNAVLYASLLLAFVLYRAFMQFIDDKFAWFFYALCVVASILVTMLLIVLFGAEAGVTISQVLGLIAYVVLVIIIKKEDLEADWKNNVVHYTPPQSSYSSSSSGYSSSNSSSSGSSTKSSSSSSGSKGYSGSSYSTDDDDEDDDSRPSCNPGELGRIIQLKLPSSAPSGRYFRVSASYINASSSGDGNGNCKITVSGTYNFKLLKYNVPNRSDVQYLLESEIKELSRRIFESLNSAVNSGIKEARRKYRTFDGEIDVDMDRIRTNVDTD